MTDDNKTTEQPAPFKSYEEMTPEERDARNEAAFNWKEGDIEILDAGDPEGDEPSFEELVPEEQPKTR
jgi:hypothetical protein